ncbi:MAG: beta-galactosidase [Phycisphaeraceae bacterium]|nr:beta-galactosidase [Phycisphaeraceae bacterium]
MMNCNRCVLGLTFVLLSYLGVWPQHTLAQNLTDPMNLAVVVPESRMDQVGWKILAGRNGGWGKFPDAYSYQRVEIDGVACLVDSYPHSQTHGSSNAIMLDWDGDPSNGMTALKPVSGMKLTFKVSVYTQPWVHNDNPRGGFARDGVRMVQWSFGPGVVPAKMVPVKDIKKQASYSWQTQRGPRIGYRMGNVPQYKITKNPVIEGFAPSSKKAVAQRKLSEASKWYDLRLVVTFSDDVATAQCVASVKSSEQGDWQNVGDPWEFPINAQLETASNPMRWNAMILDMPVAQWSARGYGKPEVNMRDRYRNFVVSVATAGASGKVKRCEMMRFDRKEVACRISAPATLFRDQMITVPIELVNSGDKLIGGDLLLRVGVQESVVASDWTLPADSQWRKDWQFTPAYSSAAKKLELVLRQAEGQYEILGQSPIQMIEHAIPSPQQNVIHNASFELPALFNGAKMYRGYEVFYSFAKAKNQRLWTALPIEGWWVHGPVAEGVSLDSQSVHSGIQSLKITAVDKTIAVVSAPGCWLPQGAVTISAWVKTQNAKAQLELDLLASNKPILHRQADLRKHIELPTNSDWVRISFSVEANRVMQALTRIKVEQGSVWIDDVQVQSAKQDSVFNLRPTEWIRLNLPIIDAKNVPMWTAGKKHLQTLTVQCDSRETLSGYVTVAMGAWDKPAADVIGRVELSELGEGRVAKLTFKTDTLMPDAYVITADYHAGNQVVLTGISQFDPLSKSGGRISQSMLLSRQAARFAIIPDYVPARIFGVGNSMFDTSGNHWVGYNIKDYQLAGELGYVCMRSRYNQELGYLIAAGALPVHQLASYIDRDVTRDKTLWNPAKKNVLDISNPKGRAQFLKQAREIGLENAANPQIASYQMANEHPFYGKDGLCPSTYADTAFRDWCKQQHGKLDILNKRWGTSYTSWDQVEQPLSARQLQVVKSQKKLKGAKAIAWTAVYGKMSKEVNKIMHAIPARGLDWYRWRTVMSLQMYSQFRDEARKVDKKTLYSTNLCWPNFWPQVTMPFFRAMDVTMLDMEYSAGQKRGLGNPAEMMEIMEMFESNSPDKPLWGIEIYTQPQWPAGSVALQNWGLVAHGMTNNLVFAWRPYSDHGRVKGNHAWEKPDAHPMWFIIDNDNTRLPGYYAMEKTKREIHTFHGQHDALSLKRYPTTTAIYVSDDTSEYLSYITGNKPYASNLTYSRTRWFI